MRVGGWSTPSALTRALLDTLTSPERDLSRIGAFWPAVQIAHEQGRRGAGRCVAILDSGFNLSLLGSDNVELAPGTADRPDPFAEHGTAVALLVRSIVPEATLYLADVSAWQPSHRPEVEKGPPPALDLAAAALRGAAARADVVVCSFGFRSDARMSDREFRYLDALDLDQPAGDFVTALRESSRSIKATLPGGCVSDCELCLALSDLDAGGPLVFAAAGNLRGEMECPASHDRVLACGFNSFAITDQGSSVVERYGTPEGFEQAFALDVVIEEMPGFRGTSFAAPLVAGLAALGTNEEFSAAVVSLSLSNLVHARLDEFLTVMRGKEGREGKDTVRDDVADGIMEGYRLLTTELAPQTHLVHGAPPKPDYPCPLCSFALARSWENWGLLHLLRGETRAAHDLLVAAATLAPRSYGVLANLARALHVLARAERDHLDRLRLLVQAAGTYHAAAVWALQAAPYLQYVNDVWDTAMGAPPEIAAIPARPIVDLPPLGSPPAGVLTGYSGAAGDPLLINAGYQALARRDTAQAMQAFGAVQRPDGPISEEARFGLGLALALDGDYEPAEQRLASAADSSNPALRRWAGYNRALVQEAMGQLDQACDAFERMADREYNLPYVDAARVARKLGDSERERAARDAAIDSEFAMRRIANGGWTPPT